jgi:hypothetical protein
MKRQVFCILELRAVSGRSLAPLELVPVYSQRKVKAKEHPPVLPAGAWVELGVSSGV